jgi:hypothetical protein
MMKKVSFVLVAIFCIPAWAVGWTNSWVGIGDIMDDAEISEGEYGYARWVSYEPALVVNGGGAERIEMRDSGRLIVESTSTPLDLLGGTGVYDILLFDESQLLYKDGVTEFIRLTQNNTAVLEGGSINLIKTLRYAAPGNENIFIYAQEDSWSWINNDPLEGIQGNWLTDGSPFRIEFINMTDDGYDPVWENIEVITPEPATISLFGLGILLLRRDA